MSGGPTFLLLRRHVTSHEPQAILNELALRAALLEEAAHLVSQLSARGPGWQGRAALLQQQCGNGAIATARWPSLTSLDRGAPLQPSSLVKHPVAAF